MIKMSPVRCNHCKHTLFIIFDYLDDCLVLQCENCKMVYGHQNMQPLDIEIEKDESYES